MVLDPGLLLLQQQRLHMHPAAYGARFAFHVFDGDDELRVVQSCSQLTLRVCEARVWFWGSLGFRTRVGGVQGFRV